MELAKATNEAAGDHDARTLVDADAPARSFGNRFVRELGFAATNPAAAAAIGRILEEPPPGYPDKLRGGALLQRLERVAGGGSNLSTDVNTLANHIGLSERSTGMGSQVNAFRHVLWQAVITARFGAKTAQAVGYAHEDEPEAIYGVRALSEKIFVNAEGEAKADQSIDLANNVIGRELGASRRPTDTLEQIAAAVLERFHTTGLWMIAERRGGAIQPTLTRLTDEQFRDVSGRLQSLQAKSTGATERVAGR